jgi:predicted nucleic acid-binding protein
MADLDIPDRPPAIAACALASYLANVGLDVGTSDLTRIHLADQALAKLYRSGWRLARHAHLDDLLQERDDLLDELCRTVELLHQAVDEAGRLRAELERRPTRIVPAPRPGGLTAALQRAKNIGVTRDDLDDLEQAARNIGNGRHPASGDDDQEWPRV